jgi:hypothetical protein
VRNQAGIIQEVHGDTYDIFCVYSRVRVAICACAYCEPIKHAHRNRNRLDLLTHVDAQAAQLGAESQ